MAPEHWNKNKQKVRKSHPLAPKLNATLHDKRLEAERHAIGADSAQEVKDELQGRGGSLTRYIERHIEELEEQGSYSQPAKFKVVLRKLRAALGEKIDWQDLDKQALAEFERYCREERGNNPNTTRKELARVRRVVRKAIEEEVLDPGSDPFLRYDMPAKVPPDRRSLRLDDIQAMEDLDLPAGSDLALARDAFVFAFYGGGARFSDVCRLKPGHIVEGRLQYRMMKTDRFVSMKLPPAALAIAEFWPGQHEEPYIFPFLRDGDEADPNELRDRIGRCLASVNQDIKTVAERAGITKPGEVSSHVARHSFADHARRHSGDLHAISQSLGHADIQQTQDYLSSFDQDAVDRLADDLWNDDRPDDDDP